MGTLSVNQETCRKVSYNPFAAGPILIATPTTEAQREMWATIALEPRASLCYNEVLAIHLRGELDHKALDFAYQEIIKRHDALRMVLSPDGRYLFLKDYSYQKINESSLSLEDLTQKEVGTLFNLHEGPCIRASLIRLTENHHTLVLSVHHIVADGWSLSILLTELSRTYSAKKLNQTIELSSPSSFISHAILEGQNGINQKNKRYWLEKFRQNFEGNNLPSDLERPRFRTYESSRLDVDFDDEFVTHLKKFAAQNGSSFFNVLMAGFHLFIHKLSKQNDIVVGMASAAQSDADKAQLVGHLVNLLPIRSKIQPEQNFKQVLKEIRTLMLDAIDHQDYSYGTLLKDLNVTRSAGEVPLVNIVFNIDQQAPNQGLEFDGLVANYTTVPRIYENFELFLNVVSCGRHLGLECQFNTNLYKKETLLNWLSSYKTYLIQLMENAQEEIGSFSPQNLYLPTKPQNRGKPIVQEKVRAPQIEEKLIGIWKNILDGKDVSPEDNFFTLGGHSLLVVEMLPLIEKELHKSISARLIFENPQLKDLASALHEQSASLNLKIEENIPVLPQADFYPVTHNQQQVWYLEEMYPDTMMHNLPSSIHLKFEVDAAILEKTLNLLIERHESLRTGLYTQDGICVQKVLPEARIKLEVVKIAEDQVQLVLNEEAKYIFNKEAPPLIRAKLFELSPQSFVFFFMAHHGIWDGWSFDIFFEELNLIYSALVNKKTPEFPAGERTLYRDYTFWQNEKIKKGEYHAEKEFWKTKLAAPLPVLELPLDFKRPITASHSGGTFPFEFNQNEICHLKNYAKEQGVSLFNLILAAFKVTLCRFTNQDDIIVGTPVRARNNPRLLNTIGYFVNTIALRSPIALEKSFETILHEVALTAAEGMENGNIPFQVILNEVEYTRDTSRTPIFQTFFSYQDVSNRKPELNGHSYQQINIDKASTHTDLDLWIKASEKKIEGAFEYRLDLFAEESIRSFHESFHYLLMNLNQKVEPLLKKFLITPLSQDKLLNEMNQTTNTAEFLPFYRLFESQVRMNPTKTAIESSSGKLSYDELNKKANRVAHALIQAGIKRGDLVGLSLHRELNLLVSILGILKAGAGYIPLDPSFPQDRLNYMIENSGLRLLLTEENLSSRFQGPRKILLEELESLQHLSQDNLQTGSLKTDTAYVIYTSGSTGHPKGVQISQKSLTNFLLSMQKVPGFTSSDKLLAVTTLSFDIATLELYLPLISGGSVYLASSYDVIDGKALKDILEKNRITTMQATPSTWRLLLAAGWKGEERFKVLCGGEGFPKDLAHKLLGQCGEVWNMYGPTETTVWSTCKKLSLDEDIITVGKPIDNTSVYILDKGLNLMPKGVVGELYIGGLGLAEGYYNRADLTHERFISHPFNSDEKIYATGDLARVTKNGEVECLGRQDGQVKVRGYRIELGEIEAEISKVKKIKENAVITKEVRPGDTRIIAFLVSRNETPSENEIKESIGEHLPKYMIPTHFVFLESLPQTLNGKIDKKALSSMFKLESTSSLSPRLGEKSNHDEIDPIRNIWKDLLKLDKISDEDNFFHIGGNSLLAIELSARLSKTLGVNFQLSTLLENPEFASFSRAIGKNPTKLKSPDQSLKTIVTIKGEGHLPPLFCFHGVGGNVLNYVSLTSGLSEDRPLLGVQSLGLNGDSLGTSIEDMAEIYIQEMKVIQPQGPYLLAGGSMGGMVALEVAHQLTDMGERVEKLIMFDTFGPEIDIKAYKSERTSFWKNLKQSLHYRKLVFISRLKKIILNLLNVPLPLEMKLFDIEMNNYRLLWKYKPRIYYGDLHLIRAKKEATGWYSDPYMGWESGIKGVIKTYEINGKHGNFIESPELPKILAKLV